MNKKIVLVVLISISVFALAGCGQKAAQNQLEKNLEKQMDREYNVDVSDNALTVESESDGKMTVGKNVEVPKDFPNDVYLVDGDVIGVIKNMGQQGYQVTIQTNKSNNEIFEIYQDKLSKDGWAEENSINMGEMIMLTGKKNGRTLNIVGVIDENDINKTVLTVHIIEE